jgi:hypothetical protein
VAYRLVRIGAVLVFAFLGSWMLTFQTLFSDLSGLGAGFDTQLYLTIGSQILLYLAAAAAFWNVFVVWRGEQGWLAKFWSVMLALAVLIVVLFAALNGLLSWETSF